MYERLDRVTIGLCLSGIAVEFVVFERRDVRVLVVVVCRAVRVIFEWRGWVLCVRDGGWGLVPVMDP